MGKVEYTESHIRFILDNWNKDEDLCIKKTGTSYGEH